MRTRGSGVLTWSMIVAALVVPIGMADVELSGEFSGYHRYQGENVVVSGPLILTGDATIFVGGGSITVNAPITCGEDRDGEDGQNGSHPGAPPTAGEPGLDGYDLTLVTAPLGMPGQPTTRGPIVVNADIDLHGGNGGAGGNGAGSDACDGEIAQYGASGGKGGNGGNLTITSCEDVEIRASLTTDGGSAGSGGDGGSVCGTIVAREYCGNGAPGGHGGSGGKISIKHKDAIQGAEIRLYNRAVGCYTLSTRGGAGGSGGSGGSGNRTQINGVGGIGGHGGAAGCAADGGQVEIVGRTVTTEAPRDTVIQTQGGSGGRGGSGGHSANTGRTVGDCDPETPPDCVDTETSWGGLGGAAGSAGAGGSVTVQSKAADAQTSVELHVYVYTSGGNGGRSGSSGASGFDQTDYDAGCNAHSSTAYDGRIAWGAEVGATAGLVLVQALTGTNLTFDCYVEAEGGDGADSGSGGNSSCGWTEEGPPEDPNCIPYCEVGGAGGAGGGGASGANVQLIGAQVNVTGAVLDLDGGNGGDGGDGGWCEGIPGLGAPSGPDGVLFISGIKIGTETIINDPQHGGSAGAAGEECPA